MLCLTEKQKLNALAFKYYQGQKWEPKAGDYYTTSRADLELYQVVEVTEDKVKTKYLIPDSPISEWDKSGFLTEGFGVNRVWVPDWVLSMDIIPIVIKSADEFKSFALQKLTEQMEYGIQLYEKEYRYISPEKFGLQKAIEIIKSM